MNFIEALQWRYATKRMTGRKIPQEKTERILEAIRLSASSMGLQPYTILCIENESVKKSLQQAAFGQPQVVESSHLLVFTAWADVTESQIDEYIMQIASVRNVPVESLSGFKSNLLSSVQNRSPEQRYEWAARQVYIALGTALSAAAVEKVDATPMEGFKPAEVDKILGLQEKGLKSVAMMALGYRDEENDFLANAEKVRRDKDQLILEIT